MLKYVPVIGGALRGMIAFGSLILAVIFTFLVKFLIAFWWLVLIILIVLIIWIITASKKKKAALEVATAAPSAPAPPPAPKPEVHAAEPDTGTATPKFCPKCGDPVDPNEKFCTKCGHNLID